jgi:hypothetical protein
MSPSTNGRPQPRRQWSRQWRYSLDHRLPAELPLVAVAANTGQPARRVQPARRCPAVGAAAAEAQPDRWWCPTTTAEAEARPAATPNHDGAREPARGGYSHRELVTAQEKEIVDFLIFCQFFANQPLDYKESCISPCNF